MALARAGAPRGPLPAPEEKRAAVQRMFDRIAPRYDVMNRLMTGGLDRRWRRLALDALALRPGERVVDLACGTGDLAEGAAARGARVIGVDFAHQMLLGARRRRVPAALARADAEALPLGDGSVDALVSGFALRNFAALPPVFAECARVLAPGGRLALLDADRPRVRWLARLHSLYFDRVVPRLGAWVADRDAYAYLPASTAYLPEPAAMREALERAGFTRVCRRELLLGAVQLVTGVRR